jgi:hypothetical protein
MSTMALGSGAPVFASRTHPCMYAIWPSPSAGGVCTMVLPWSRKGVSWRQKGPRMAEAVAEVPAAAALRTVMSSTRLVGLVLVGEWSGVAWHGVARRRGPTEVGTHDSNPMTSQRSWPSFLLLVDI